MRAFGQYESYKSSSVEWIGDIPSHWETRKFKYSVAQKAIKSSDYTFKIGLENIEGKTSKFIATEEDAFNEDGIVFRAGDVLFGKLRPYLVKVYIPKQDGICVSEFLVLSPLVEISSSHFVKYLMLSSDFIDIVNGSTYGSKMPRASWDFVGNLKIPLPPLEEQKQIADFLDKKSTQIDEFIADKQALIALFEEQKSAVINEAVTKGLNKTAPLKPSGIEWLGNIPSHWEAKKLKYSMQIKSGIGITANDLKDDGSFKVYGGNGCIGFYDAFNTVDEVLIIGRVGAKCGNVHFVNEKIWVSDNALIVETSENYAFMYYLLSSLNLNKLSTSTAQPLITGSDIKNYTVALPPLEEQKQIVDYLEKELSTIDTLIQTAKAEITLIEEYKTSLINEVVTGKIKI